MRRQIFKTQSDYEWLLNEFGFNWVFEALQHRSEDEQARFREVFYERMLNAHSPQEWVFEALQHRSEDDQARFREVFYERMLNAHSPQEVAQKALGADSPVDAAFKLLQTSSERRELLKRLQQEQNVAVE